jgi:hypothetical protein
MKTMNEKTALAVRLLAPEFGDEVPDALDTESSIIAERRVRAHRLRLTGRKLAEIAAELKCSVPTVHRDLAHVRTSFKLLAQQDAADHRAQLLDELSFAKAEARSAWLESKSTSFETTASRRTTESGAYDQTARKQKTREGNPAYLKTYLEALRLHGHIVGLAGGDDTKDKAGPPPVKLVAGIDPLELV